MGIPNINKHKWFANKLVILSVFLGIVVYTLCAIILYNPVKRTSGSIPNEVYIWQRQWNQNVSDALLEA